MPFQPVPGIAQVTLVGQIDGQLTNNNLYFRGPPSGWTALNVGDLATAIGAWYGSTMLTLLSSAFSLLRTHARVLSTPEGFVADSLEGAGSGGGGGAFVPNNVAPCISFRTAVGGRSGRGRNYIPGTPQGVVTGNTLQASFAQDFVIAYSSLLAGGDVLPAEMVWCVVSRYEAKVLRPEGVAYNVLRVLFTDLTVDSQRRRLPGRGR